MEWTTKDELKAFAEGWRYQNGYVARTYIPSSPFTSPFQIVEHIREKGKKSKWHRNIFFQLPWTEADDRLTHREGWMINRNGRIVSRGHPFKPNEEAQQHVLEGATTDPLCGKTLARMAKLRLLQGAAY